MIDGLDHMVLNGDNIRTSYSTQLNVPYDTNILRVSSSIRNPIYFLEEKALGRDFDQRTVTNMSNANAAYDETNEKAVLKFVGASSPVITYEGNVADTKDDIADSVRNYLSYVLQKKRTAVFAGQDPNLVRLDPPTLTELAGTGNITTSGYFDQVVTIDDAAMKKTDGQTFFQPGEDGKTYLGAYIDFKDLGRTFSMNDLIGTGFNSTCKTCDNHYSVMFVNGISGGTTSAQGYVYQKQDQGSSDYILRIDIGSLRSKGVNSGADLAKALVDITSECYDFHYTQYASEGSKLYIYDNRESASGTMDATFDTVPYYSIDTNVFDITMSTSDGRSIHAEYAYDFGDAADYASNALKKMLTNTNIQLNATDYTYIDVKGSEYANIAVNSEFESFVREDSIGLNIQMSGEKSDYMKLPYVAMNTMMMHLHKANVSTRQGRRCWRRQIRVRRE